MDCWQLSVLLAGDALADYLDEGRPKPCSTELDPTRRSQEIKPTH